MVHNPCLKTEWVCVLSLDPVRNVGMYEKCWNVINCLYGRYYSK